MYSSNMKKTPLCLFALLFLVSCGGQQSSKTSFYSAKKEVSQFDHEMLISSPGTQFTHIATIQPSVVDNEPLQATGIDKNENIVYITSNTQGEIIRGGLDLVSISSLGSPSVISSLISNQSEYAEVKYKDGYVFMVGQKKGIEKNDAVLTVVNVSNSASPSVASELTFEDGYYATSIDIEGNLAYITVPNIGLKVVNISNPNLVVLQETQILSSSTNSAPGLLPPGVSIIHQITSDWNTSYNYQIQIKNDGSNPILNWTLCFNYNHVVGPTVWNGSLNSSSAQPNWKIDPMPYNQIIYPGSNVTMGWTGTPGGVNGDVIENIQFIPEANASCTQSAGLAFDNALFVRRYNNKSLVLGGADQHKLILNSGSGSSSLVKNISSSIQEAPGRFVIKNNSFFSNAGNSGLTIIDGLNDSPIISFQESIPGTGNGLAIDSCDRLYLAQGEVGLQVVNAANHASPANLGYFDYADDAGSANNVFNAKINGINYVFVADGRGGVKIIKVQSQSCPGEMAGISCNVYNFAPSSPGTLPNMATMTPVGSFVTEQFDVINQSSSNSFPLFPESLKYLKTYYGVLCEGKFTPSSAGVATIRMSSDDGSRLSLDGVVVINNDGLHSAVSKSATLTLEARPYDFKLEYFQGPASAINLELYIKYLTSPEQLLKNLSH